MDQSKIDAAHELAATCLETFREIFIPEERSRYVLTIIARNEDHPDGSRDIIVSSDTPEGMRQALKLTDEPHKGEIKAP